MGDEIHLRGLVEFSNWCQKDCVYCGIRRSNQKTERYRLSVEEILKAVQNADSLGYKTVVLQSAEDAFYSVDKLCKLVKNIKDTCDVAITLCVGERSYEEYKALKDAGTDRYLLRFETSDKELFRKLKPDSRFEDRLKCLYWLCELGFQVGSGIMIGLPGQSIESLAHDIMLFKELDLDMVGVGPFLSHPDTPLRKCAGGTLNMTLKVVVLTRLVLPFAHIPATTAMGTVDPQGRQKALQCGANVLMPNTTPGKYRKHYLIYPNKICIDEQPKDCTFCIQSMVKSLGRTIATDYGHAF